MCHKVGGLTCIFTAELLLLHRSPRLMLLRYLPPSLCLCNATELESPCDIETEFSVRRVESQSRDGPEAQVSDSRCLAARCTHAWQYAEAIHSTLLCISGSSSGAGERSDLSSA